MKLPCEMIQDLLPLYHDGVCSGVSRTLVEEHLAGCEDCGKVLKALDVEIEVPELEVEKAEPLVKIQMNWEKRSRREKIKYICGGIAAFFVAVTAWWGLTQWRVVPLKANDYIIKKAVQLESGIVHIEYTLMYEKASPEMGITEDGVLYENYKRPILEKRLERIPSGSAGVYLDPEDRNWFGEENCNAFCLGDPESEEHILVWELGKEMPAASKNTEEAYRDLKDAYAAPNAPEEPDVLSVVNMEPMAPELWDESDMVEETMVSGDDLEE